MGNSASTQMEDVPCLYREKDLKEVKRHIRCVSKFVMHREQARLIIDVIKEMRKYLETREFPRSSFPILVQIYNLLEALYSALKELRSLQDFWDFTPSMAVGLLPCGKDFSDLGVWTSQLNDDFELRIYPLPKYERVRPDDPDARTIKEIIGGPEVTNRVGFKSLEGVAHSILPYLSRRDREFMAQKMTENRPLVQKKKEFLGNILQRAREDGPGSPPLQEVDAGDLSGTQVLLGSGCFGKVYQVEWLGSSCALKQFECDDNSWIEEANILSKLRHPNIVSVFGYVHRTSSHSHHGILMELLGKDLRDIIFDRSTPDHRPFTNMAALDIMLQIARAMKYLHSRNIIHRDLKPANILVAAPDLKKGAAMPRNALMSLKVKLTDFGLAKVKEKGCNTETMTSRLGSGRYRAPEVRAAAEKTHETRYNLSADVYSFGITSFEILTGNEGDEAQRSRSNTDDFVEKMKTDLLQQCWDETSGNRPLFPHICKRLEKFKYQLARQEGDSYR